MADTERQDSKKTVPREKISNVKIQIQLFTIVAVIYYLLNIAFPTDYAKDADNSLRIYPQIAAAALAFVSLWISFISIRRLWKNKMMRAFILLLGLSFIYILYPMKPAENTAYVIRTYMAIITMCALYVMLIRVKDDRYWMRYVYLIYLFQLAFCLYSLFMDRMVFANSMEKEFDSNAGFMLITCIPLALTIPAKRFRVYIYGLLMLACLYSGQRSAALAAAVSLPFCLWYLRGSIRKLDIAILLFLGVAFIIPILTEALQNIQLRNEIDINRGSMGSGRTIFWAIVVSDFFGQGPIHLMFGNGTDSVATLLDRTYGLAIGAHNGWLDILYTFGFLGLFLYARIFFLFLRRNKPISTTLPDYRNMYLILFLIFFVKSITSHGYFDISVVPFLTTVAMVEGMRDRQLQKTHTNETCDT